MNSSVRMEHICCVTHRGEAVTHLTQHSGLGSFGMKFASFSLCTESRNYLCIIWDLELFPYALNELHTSSIFLSMKWIEYWLLLNESHNFIYNFVIAEIFNKGMPTYDNLYKYPKSDGAFVQTTCFNIPLKETVQLLHGFTVILCTRTEITVVRWHSTCVCKGGVFPLEKIFTFSVWMCLWEEENLSAQKQSCMRVKDVKIMIVFKLKFTIQVMITACNHKSSEIALWILEVQVRHRTYLHCYLCLIILW